MLSDDEIMIITVVAAVIIYSYMDNVLGHHFLPFEDDINDLHLKRNDSH
jgi:hypothetical protein